MSATQVRTTMGWSTYADWRYLISWERTTQPAPARREGGLPAAPPRRRRRAGRGRGGSLTNNTLTNNTPSPTIAGYPSDSLFNLNGATRIGPLNLTATVSNLFNKKPDAGGYFVADQTQGFGTYDPYGDLVGRRYSLGVTMSF